MKKILILLLIINLGFSNNKIKDIFKELNNTEIVNRQVLILNKIRPLYSTLTDSLKYEFHFYEGYIKMRLGKLNEAKISYNKAIDGFKKIGYRERLYVTKIHLSHIYINQNQINDALNILNSINGYIIKDKTEFYITYSGLLTNINFGKSNYYAKIALNEAIKNNNIKGILKSYNLIATNYYKKRSIKETIEFSEKALALAEKHKFKTEIMYITYNLSLYYSELKKFKLSNKYLDKVDFTNTPLIDTNIKMLTLAQRALNNHELNEFEISKKNISDFLKLYSTNKEPNMLSSIYIIEGKNYLKISNPTQALNSFKTALGLSKKYNNLKNEAECYSLLSSTYKAINQIDNAYLYIIKYYELIRKNELEKTKEELNLQDINYRISNFQKELNFKNQKIELLNLKNTKYTYQLTGLAIFIFGLIFFLYRQRKINQITKKNTLYVNEINQLKQEHLENRITFSSNQILEFAIQIQDQNKILQELKSKILNVFKNIKNHNNQSELQNLIFDINTALDHNNEKIKLNTEVSNATDQFLYSIKEKYPELNEKEIQIITYLRLNYKTKQIASLMAINGQTVNNHRTTIRKKMNISKEINLNQFLNSL